MLKKLWRNYGINPFDTLLKRAQKKGETRFLICWNRGLGDIPLGLYSLIEHIRTYIPNADITVATRCDLSEGFKMLEKISILSNPKWKRGQPFNLKDTLDRYGLSVLSFDVILERPDPTRWLKWQLGRVTPKLNWDSEWDVFCQKFCLDPEKTYLGVHLQTETHYSYEKNWPLSYWEEVFQKIADQRQIRVLVFGVAPRPVFKGENIIDLRGKTTLFEMLSLIKNRCRYLLVPDSGILSITYYIDSAFPIDIVSLWADPKQGILKQRVASPNPMLRHTPIIARNKDLKTVGVNQVIEALFPKATV